MLLAVLGLLIYKEARQARGELQGWGNTTRFDRQAAIMYFVIFIIIWPVVFFFIMRDRGLRTVPNLIITTVTVLTAASFLIPYPLLGIWCGWESAKIADRKIFEQEERHRAQTRASRAPRKVPSKCTCS